MNKISYSDSKIKHRLHMGSKSNSILTIIETWLTISFLCLSNFILVFLTQALLLTWLNQFKFEYILISLFISLLVTIFCLYFIKQNIRIIPHIKIAIIPIILLVTIILIFYPHDSLGGRDEGTYSGLAIILSKHYSLSVPSYLNKVPLVHDSPVKSINLTTPTYVVWLATQNTLFGLQWMLRSNIVLVILGLSSLFLVLTLISSRFLGFITIILYSTTMPFLWFTREIMTENMAIFLLWYLLLSFFLFIKTKKYYFLINLFISSWLFSFTRNEGLFMQIPIFMVLAIVLYLKKILPVKKILLVLVIYAFIIILSFLINNSFLPFYENANITFPITSAFNFSMGKSNIVRLGDKIPDFVFRMLSKQNLSIVLYSFFLMIVLLITRTKKIVINIFFYVCLLGIISLEFIKLKNPSITLEQPWLYRRYLYALLPFGYLNISILLNKFMSKKLFTIICCGFIIINLVLSSRTLTLKNNWLITEKIDKLIDDVNINDFIIIDGKLLNNYFPLSYIALHKEERNLYNYWIEIGDWKPKEKKYNGLPYNKLFLLTDKSNKKYMNFKINLLNAERVESAQLQPNCQLGLLADELRLTISDFYYLPYSDVLGYCNKMNNEIININKQIYLYELKL